MLADRLRGVNSSGLPACLIPTWEEVIGRVKVMSVHVIYRLLRRRRDQKLQLKRDNRRTPSPSETDSPRGPFVLPWSSLPGDVFCDQLGSAQLRQGYKILQNFNSLSAEKPCSMSYKQ